MLPTSNLVYLDVRTLDLERVWEEGVAFTVEVVPDGSFPRLRPLVVTPLHHLHNTHEG